MSHIYFNPNQDDHPHEVVGDITSERTKEIHDFKFTILKSYDPEYGNHHHYSTTRRSSSSAKCESPKMRLYKKFMKSHNNDNDDQTIEDEVLKQVGSPRENCGENSTNNNNFVLFRTCVDCSTTKTPLWRSGPHGPKSLCNACGIRQRKARRAAMAASETPCDNTNSYNISTLNNPLHQTQFVVPKMKKRSKNRAKNKPLLFSPSNLDHQTKKICFRQFALNLSNKLCLHRIFPHDEKEAAILLMALSCGFVEG